MIKINQIIVTDTRVNITVNIKKHYSGTKHFSYQDKYFTYRENGIVYKEYSI